MTIEQYLSGTVNFDITEDALKVILIDRGVAENTEIALVAERDKELCKADLYMWIASSPNRKGSVSDSDNSWSHSDGGFTLTDADKRAYISLANVIYEKWDDVKKSHSRFKIQSHGIRHLKINKYTGC